MPANDALPADDQDGAPWPAIGVAARAIIPDGDGRVLLLRRAEDAKSDPGVWDLPGGKLDYGETLEQALVREVREETGLAVAVGAPIHIAHFTRDPFWVTSVAFACESTGGEVRLSAEHSEFAWIGVHEASGLPSASAVAEQLAAYAATLDSPS